MTPDVDPRLQPDPAGARVAGWCVVALAFLVILSAILLT